MPHRRSGTKETSIEVTPIRRLRIREVATKMWPAFIIFAASCFATSAIGSGLILGNDYTEVQINPVGFFARMRFAWFPNLYLGTHSGFMHDYESPYGWAFAVLQLLHFSGTMRQRIVDFLLFALISAAMYWCLGEIERGIDRRARLCAALTYLFAIYVAFNVGNGTPIFLPSYAATPLYIGIAAATLSRRLRLPVGGILMGVVTFVGGGINAPLIVINGIVIALYALVYFLSSRSNDNARRILLFGAIAFTSTVALNLYWIAPFLDYMRTVWLGSLLDESPAIHNSDSSYSNVLRGLGQWAIFQGDQNGPWFRWAESYHTGVFSFLLWCPPLIAFAGLALRRRTTIASVFFIVLAALSVPLAVGYYHGAFTVPLYDVLYSHVPGFQMFRSSYKWVWPYQFAIAGLVGLTAADLGRRRRRMHPIVHRLPPLIIGAIVTATFVPVVANKMYAPSLPVPTWVTKESKLIPSDSAYRLALYPGGYLEWFDWGDRAFQLETALTDRALVTGYLSGAPSEPSHVLLTRAFKLARLGDANAADIFRTLSVNTFLQRDDFRSLVDFAFVGSSVQTPTTLAHEILQRVLQAKPERNDGANRTYSLAQPLPSVYGVSKGRLDARPAVALAASADYHAISRGDAVITADTLSLKDLTEVKEPVEFSGDIQSMGDLAMTMSLSNGAQVECVKPDCEISVRTTGRYKVALLSMSAYPSNIGQAFEMPGTDFSQANGVSAPHSIAVDRQKLRGESGTTNWRGYGTVDLHGGAHRLLIPNATPTSPSLVAFVPYDQWREMKDSVRAVIRKLPEVSFETTVNAKSAQIILPSGQYYVAASARKALSAAPLFDVTRRLASSRNEPDFGVTSMAGYAKTLELPFFPSDGALQSPPSLMPSPWYLDASTYRWSRGSPTSWLLIRPKSEFTVVLPARSPAIAQMTFHIVSVAGPARRFEILVDGHSAATFVVPSATLPGSTEEGRTPLRTGSPTAISLRVKMKPGVNKVTLSTPAANTLPAVAVDPLIQAATEIVGGLAQDVAFTVDAANVKWQSSIGAASTIRSVGARAINVTFSRSRHAVASFAALRLPVDAHDFSGGPRLEVRAASNDPQSKQWLAATMSDGRGNFTYRVVQLVNGAADFFPEAMLANSFTDDHLRVLGWWWVTAPSQNGKLRGANVTYSLLDLYVARSLGVGRQKVRSALGSVALAVDGIAIARSIQLHAGTHHITARGAQDQIGDLLIRKVGSGEASFVKLHVRRATPVSIDVVPERTRKPFLLVLNESYHPGWQATLDGNILHHVFVNGFANGWIVPATKARAVIALRFTPQRLFDWSAIASALAWLAASGTLLKYRT